MIDLESDEPVAIVPNNVFVPGKVVIAIQFPGNDISNKQTYVFSLSENLNQSTEKSLSSSNLTVSMMTPNAVTKGKIEFL